MKKIYAIFIFLSAFYLVTSIDKTQVFHDPKYDIIFHNGKLYFPSKSPDTNVGEKNNEVYSDTHGQENSNTNQNNHSNANPHHQEKLVSGATFWFYLFAILCKMFLNLKSGIICHLINLTQFFNHF